MEIKHGGGGDQPRLSKRGDGGNLGVQDKGNQEIVSLFVENLLETLHWKGLWFSFARHGEVVSVYIARKWSRGGKRFGFVRMKNLVEAERVMERLHGFTLYGSRLYVKREKNNYEWEKKRVVKPFSYNPGPSRSDYGERHGVGINLCGNRNFYGGGTVVGDVQLLRKGNLDRSQRVSLHCWNSTTLKKIAGLWGTFEGLGANAKHNLNCEKVSVLIATNVAKWIDEIVEVETGDKVFQVGIREVGSNDGTSYPLCNTGIRSPRGSEDSDESNDISDVAPKLRVEDECSDRCRPSTEEEAFQTMCTERDAINAVSREEEALRRQINISELMGGEPNVLPVESVEVCIALPQKDSNGELGLDLAILDGPGTGSLIPKTGLEFNSKEGELALGSKEAMGPVAHEVGRNFESPQARILSWADRVKLNAGPLDLRFNYVEGNNDDSDGNFSVDCEVIKGRKGKGKARKFSSLLEIQNKSILDNERRRRDKALKKEKLKQGFSGGY
ncbi:hypothetical protein V6N13_142588 [Hibiscus sabdariffa]